jgi:hypothetical protein
MHETTVTNMERPAPSFNQSSPEITSAMKSSFQSLSEWRDILPDGVQRPPGELHAFKVEAVGMALSIRAK